VAAAILACISIESYAQARDFFTADGQFTICKFRQFSDCGLLSPDIAAGNQFTDTQREILRKLQRLLTLKKIESTDLTAAFGKPTSVLRPPGHSGQPDMLLYNWLTDDPKVCPLCGVRIAFSGDALFSIDFDVNDKFMVGWRTPVHPSAP
jgi:hypothetical protein